MFSANCLRIIDLTSDGESNVGRTLCDDVRMWADIERLDIIVTYEKIQSKIELERFFVQQIIEYHNFGAVPMLHIEAHGCHEYIEIGSGEVVPWRQMYGYFRSLNVAVRNKLLVTMATCKAAWSYRGTTITDAAPMYALIAPVSGVSIGEVGAAFQAFYQSLIQYRDLDLSFERLASHVPYERRFVMFHCESMFYRAARSYINRHCIGQAKHERRERLLSQARAEGFVNDMSIGRMRKLLKAAMAVPNEVRLKVFYDSYMMLDKYSDNVKRFQYNPELLAT